MSKKFLMSLSTQMTGKKELAKQRAIWKALGQDDYYEKRVKAEKRRFKRLKKKLDKQKVFTGLTK